LKHNRDVYEVYIKKTIEYTDTLCGFVKRTRTKYPSEPLLESACMFKKHVQELLVYTSQTCPNSPKSSEKLVVVTPINKDKRVRFAEPVTSSNNIPKQTDSLKTKVSIKPLLTSTGVNLTTSANGSKPSTRPPLNHSQLMNFVSKFLRTVRFENDQVAKIMRSKDDAPNAIIKCIKNVQVRLNANVRNVRTDNGTEFVNQTLRDFYENVGRSIQHSFLYLKPFSDSSSIQQTLYELMYDKKPNLSFFHVFGSLCYPTNDSEDLVTVAVAPRSVKIADSHVSTSIDQDAPSSSIPLKQDQEHSSIISQGVEESPKTPLFNDDPLHESLHEDSTSQGSSSNVRPSHTSFELIGRWTKDHPIANCHTP
nr:hypothetical protein [Tanacetum cinerariifolium]